MNERTKLGLGVLEAALLLGVLGDALLRATPWGLNVALWVGAFLAATLALTRHKGAREALSSSTREGRWLWPAALLCAAAFAWRDSLTLRTLDALMILGALSLLALRSRGGRLRLAGVTEYALAALTSAANALFGVLPLVFADVKWKELPRAGWSRHAVAVARGVLFALPLLLLFGALFMAADAIYEGLVRDTFSFDGEFIVSHVVLACFLAWLTGGYLRGALLARKPVTSFVGLSSYTTLNLKATSPQPAHETARAGGPVGGPPPHSAPAVAREEAKDPSELRGLFSSGVGGEAGGTGAQGETVKKDETANKADAEGAGRREGVGPDSGARAAWASAENKTADAKQPDVKSDVKESRGAEARGAEAGGAPGAESRRLLSLGMVEVGVVLGLLDALFFSFVAVQLRYFFGDAGHVINSAGLTFSDYARRGFFELVWVAVLALPLLLAAHWLLRKDEAGRNERLFRALAGGMIAMLFVIMASAIWRMRLYQTAYGQTELRLYTTVFMCWLAAVLVWFAATVLRGRRERFAWGAVVAGFVVVAALHVANPTDLIVRTNLARAHAGRNFDARYAVSLGDDAAPALVGALGEMGARDRNYVAYRLLNRAARRERDDWRSWNLSRWRARRLVKGNEAALSAWAQEYKDEMIKAK